MIFDRYFRNPLIWDYTICTLFCGLAIYFYITDKLKLPNKDYSISITTDTTNVSLTIAGFILTLLTVLITFKSNSKIRRLEVGSEEPMFDLFFASGFYYESVKHLKNGIKSLLFIAVLGYSFKLFVPDQYKIYSFFFNIIGLGIIILTIWRCVLILSKILDFQREGDEQ